MRILHLLLLTILTTNVAFAQTYTADLTGSGVIKSGDLISTTTATATASFQLVTAPGNPSATALSYVLSLDDFDIDGTKTPDLGDDITAIHLHTLTECAAATCLPGDTAGTKHVLNIFGVPREDDADLSIDLAMSQVSGVWDPTDANELTPAPGQDPNDYLDELVNGQLFIMVHTREFSAGAAGGVLIPEPASAHAMVLGTLMCFLAGWRRRRIR